PDTAKRAMLCQSARALAAWAYRRKKRACHAPTDPPASVGGGAPRRPLRPAEPFGADAIAFKQAVAAPRAPRLLIMIGKVAHAKFDRVDPQPFGRFIERGFECKRSRCRSWRAHRDGLRLIGTDESVRGRDVGAGIKKARIDRGGVGVIGVG